jgi:hypothetical protein
MLSFQIRFYPPKFVYHDASKSIVEAFQYLKDDSEKGFESYQFKLRNKFKEYRRLKDDESIIGKRKKHATQLTGKIYTKVFVYLNLRI